ncbi:MAG: hypothetical protein R3B54_11810 [Bdellovibrionota bacterium]
MKYLTIGLTLAMFLLAGCGSDKKGTTAGAGGPGGSGSGTENGGNGGGANFGDTYFPLAKNLEWTYDTKVEGTSVCKAGKQVTKVNAMAKDQTGNDYYVVIGDTCLPYGAFRAEEGSTLIQVGQWETYLSAKFEVGETWSSLLGSYEYVEKLESFETPAGTFNDCVVREEGTTKTRDTYCKGVGLVHTQGTNFESTLIKKSFTRKPQKQC